MCGIAGIVSSEHIEQNIVQSMTDALKHRGPDAQSIYLDETKRIALGHTRLSIIDLSTEANQPMYSGDNRYIIVFNGEIYNFLEIRKQLQLLNASIQFRTSSDTEIILHAFAQWGVSMVERLNGMFAIAIHDSVEHRVFVFRDRVGKKPIFYFRNDKSFVFASEIKSLLKHPVINSCLEIDRNAIHEFLHLGYIPEPKTIYRSIKKFPSGHYAVIENGSVSIYPYWQAKEVLRQETKDVDAKKLKDDLKERLTGAVSRRLISDVPLGVFLSGGTDSSLVAAIAREHKTGQLKTFNIGFKEGKFDERAYAAKVAKHIGTDHVEYELSEKEAIAIMETYLQHMDEPFADTSTIPSMLVAQLARKDVKVALTGDGGDELFLGYGSYTWARRLSNPLVKLTKASLAAAMNAFGKDRYKRIAHVLNDERGMLERSHIFSQEQYFFSHKELSALLKDKQAYEPFQYTDPVESDHLSEEEKQALFDFNYYLKDDLLVKVDRASMYHALECRSPLLDQKVVEFALAAPFEIKRRNGVNKWILKEILRDYLPDDLIFRPKWGFSIPLAQWMRGDLSYLLNYLSDENLSKTGVFNESMVSSLLKRFLNGEDYLYNRLWVLIVAQTYLLKQ